MSSWRGVRELLGPTGYVDAVIEPRQTRARLMAGLRLLETRRDRNPPKKHGNIPL